jgi:hypothetical protein
MLLEDVKTLLTGIAPVIFLGEIGDTTDSALCIYHSGGASPKHAFDGRIYEQPTFQVRVRHISAATAVSWAYQVKDTLDGINGLTVNSVRYISIFQTGDIVPLGKDAKGRTEYTVNFQAKIKR